MKIAKGLFSFILVFSITLSAMIVPAQAYTYEPYWGAEAIKTGIGGELLFFSDIHDYEDDYLYYNGSTGEAKGVFQYLSDNGKYPGMYVVNGDYMQKDSELTDEPGVFSKVNSYIDEYSGDVPVVSIMGNHDNTAAVGSFTGEAVFEQYVGNNHYGIVAKGVDENDSSKTLYYVYAFGYAPSEEDDAAGSRASATNKYWFNPDQIEAMDQALAEIYGDDNTKNQGVPTFIASHLPLHYFTAERWVANAAEVIEVLNNFQMLSLFGAIITRRRTRLMVQLNYQGTPSAHMPILTALMQTVKIQHRRSILLIFQTEPYAAIRSVMIQAKTQKWHCMLLWKTAMLPSIT